MHLRMTKEPLLQIVSYVMGAVERRHTLNILSNVKIDLDAQHLSLTGSDNEVELVATVQLATGMCLAPGATTIPARKFVEICKSLPAQALIDIEADEQRCVIKSGKSRFVLGVLPAQDYPILGQDHQPLAVVEVTHADLKRLFDKTAFAMAVQDVRFYLTGTLLEYDSHQLRAVTTDGHRLAMCEVDAKAQQAPTDTTVQAIVPRKAVAELQRLLAMHDQSLKLSLGRELFHISIELMSRDKELTVELAFTSKLIDGKFPDYRRVIPHEHTKHATLEHDGFKQSLQRVSILSNEKLRGIILDFVGDNLTLRAKNPEQDEAVEEFAIQYQGEPIEMSFNSQYLLDILNVMTNSSLHMYMSEATRSVLIQDPEQQEQVYVVMPMRI